MWWQGSDHGKIHHQARFAVHPGVLGSHTDSVLPREHRPGRPNQADCRRQETRPRHREQPARLVPPHRDERRWHDQVRRERQHHRNPHVGEVFPLRWRPSPRGPWRELPEVGPVGLEHSGRQVPLHREACHCGNHHGGGARNRCRHSERTQTLLILGHICHVPLGPVCLHARILVRHALTAVLWRVPQGRHWRRLLFANIWRWWPVCRVPRLGVLHTPRVHPGCNLDGIHGPHHALPAA